VVAGGPGLATATEHVTAHATASHKHLGCLNNAGSEYRLKYRPRACGHFGPHGENAGGVLLKKIHWSSWNGSIARGRAIECGFHLPCANIAVRLKAYRIGHHCDGQDADIYTRLRSKSSHGTTTVSTVQCSGPAY
jgi:hypothetical protein